MKNNRVLLASSASVFSRQTSGVLKGIEKEGNQRHTAIQPLKFVLLSTCTGLKEGTEIQTKRKKNKGINYEHSNYI